MAEAAEDVIRDDIEDATSEDVADEGDQKKSKKKSKPVEQSYPLKVTYCGECSLPFEYCEFNPNYDKCQKWWEGNFPDIFEEMMKVNDGEGEGDETKKRQKRGGKGVIKAKKKIEKSKITVGRVQRNKRKYVTIIRGLETHEISLKDAAKLFGKKLSSGSSQSGNEIVIQGDRVDDVIEILEKEYPQIDEDDIEDVGDMKR